MSEIRKSTGRGANGERFVCPKCMSWCLTPSGPPCPRYPTPDDDLYAFYAYAAPQEYAPGRWRITTRRDVALAYGASLRQHVDMSNPPMQNVSPGSRRFVGISITGNQVNSDGTTTAIPDTTTPLVLTASKPEIVAEVDPTNSRRVIISAGAIAPGAPDVGGTVVVNTDPALPINTTVSIPVTVSSAPDRRRADWDGTQGPA